MTGRERTARLDEVLRDPYLFPEGVPKPARRTIYRWLALYRKAEGDPLRALEPKKRIDHDHPRCVPPDLLAAVISLRERAPRLSFKEILKRIDHPDRHRVSLRSVSRAMRQFGYDRRDKRRRIADLRRSPTGLVTWDLLRWEADFPNEVWHADSTPAIWLARGRHREKPVQLHLVNIIDDHSRHLVGGGFTVRLRVVDLLAFLVPAIRVYGCPSLLYLDKASIHRSAIVVNGIARLGGQAIFGTTGHAPGHGKVERIHQHQQDTLLEDLRLSPVESVAEANLAYQLWCERYAEEEHGETGESPRCRWERILENTRIPGEDEILWAFRGSDSREINEVGQIHWSGRVYEAPPTHRRRRPYRVEIRFDLLDETTIWIEDEDGTHHACPLYRVRSHTERRKKHTNPRAPGVPFSSLFLEQDEGEGSPAP